MTEKRFKNKNGFIIQTDYSIPRFGFKQSILLLLTLFITFTLGTGIVEKVPTILELPALLIVSCIVGYSVSFIQFFKKGNVKKSRLIIGGLLSSLAFIMLFSFYYANTIL